VFEAEEEGAGMFEVLGGDWMMSEQEKKNEVRYIDR
jgi:hypothetical protein